MSWKNASMASLAQPGHGLVRPWERGRSFTLDSHAPTAQAARVVERHWIVRWDTGDEPFRQEILPPPSINVVLEPSGARIWGLPTQRNTRLLAGQGWAVGSKLRPGVFTALTGVDAVSITDG